MDPSVTLTIEPQSEPIAGRIRLPDGTVLPFVGYLQLVSALERVRADPDAPGPAPGARTGV